MRNTTTLAASRRRENRVFVVAAIVGVLAGIGLKWWYDVLVYPEPELIAAVDSPDGSLRCVITSARLPGLVAGPGWIVFTIERIDPHTHESYGPLGGRQMIAQEESGLSYRHPQIRWSGRDAWVTFADPTPRPSLHAHISDAEQDWAWENSSIAATRPSTSRASQ